jgi:hypothetical protein
MSHFNVLAYKIRVNTKNTVLIHCASEMFQQFFYTGHTQKNGAVSKVNTKCISHLTRAQHTPSAAATVQVSHLVITIL